MDAEGLQWSRVEGQTLERTRDAFHALLDDLMTSLDELNRRHAGDRDIGYLLVRLVGTNQFYERKRRQAEEAAANKVCFDVIF